MFFIVFYGHSKAKIFSLDQFYANINGITSKLENYCQKLIFHSIFWLVLGKEDKIMICPFFKFSALEHFCGPKLISWVDIWVVLIWYSFQSVWVNLEGEFEKWTKCTRKMDKMQRGIKVTCFRCHPKRWNVGVDRQRAEKTEGIQRAYNMAVAILRGDVWFFLINLFKICWSAPSSNKLFLQ